MHGDQICDALKEALAHRGSQYCSKDYHYRFLVAQYHLMGSMRAKGVSEHRHLGTQPPTDQHTTIVNPIP